MGQERRSSGPAIAAIAAVAAILTGSGREVEAQCVQDSQCKGTRICENGKCVEHAQGEVKPTSTCECAGAAPSGRAGGVHLGEAQIAALKAAGLDAKEMAMADALAARGFSGDEVVAAFRDQKLLLGSYPELAPFGSATVETIAVAHKLGLDSGDGLAFV